MKTNEKNKFILFGIRFKIKKIKMILSKYSYALKNSVL